MSTSLIHTIYIAIAYLVLFSSAEILYHFVHLKAEVTRKYVHIVTGLLTMLFPPLIGNHWLVLALCGSFFILLAISMRVKWFPSIHAVPRKTVGSLMYPIIVFGCFLLYQFYDQIEMYYIPILIMAISDPIAQVVGKRWPKGIYRIGGHAKTLSGSFAFFLSAFVIAALILAASAHLAPIVLVASTFAIAMLTAIAEGVSTNGLDNLTIPAAAALVLVSLNELQIVVP